MVSGRGLGKYQLIRQIARGGMAEIFLAVAKGPVGFTKLVVCKQIWPELANDADFVSMFMDEARLSARLHHPNVVQTYEVGLDQDRLFLAMEYLEGQPLHLVINRMRGYNGLSLPLHLHIISEVLGALDYAHNLVDFDGRPLGVVHRDVSPQNVFLTYDGVVKLVDFGIAKTLAGSHQTRPGMLKGRLAYMAPEQLRALSVDHRADLFAVGIMLWEAVAGRRMWQGMTEATIIRHLMSGEPLASPPSTPPAPPWPDGIEPILTRALAINPADRYGSAAEFRADVDRLLAGAAESHLRALGKVISHLFADDRARMRSLVEQKIAALNAEGDGNDREGRGTPFPRLLAPTPLPSASDSARPSHLTVPAIATPAGPERTRLVRRRSLALSLAAGAAFVLLVGVVAHGSRRVGVLGAGAATPAAAPPVAPAAGLPIIAPPVTVPAAPTTGAVTAADDPLRIVIEPSPASEREAEPKRRNARRTRGGLIRNGDESGENNPETRESKDNRDSRPKRDENSDDTAAPRSAPPASRDLEVHNPFDVTLSAPKAASTLRPIDTNDPYRNDRPSTP